MVDELLMGDENAAEEQTAGDWRSDLLLMGNGVMQGYSAYSASMTVLNENNTMLRG